MARIQIYFDEDAVRKATVNALRGRGVNVLTVSEAGLLGRPDQEHLAFATGRGYVLYSHNMGDYQRLHTEWITAGRTHAGIIVSTQRGFSVGAEARRLLLIHSRLSAEVMRDRLEFLNNWT